MPFTIATIKYIIAGLELRKYEENGETLLESY